jgi:hypothetical protein
MDKAALRIGAIAFIHRFGLDLNGHVNFHVCAVDRVFLGVTDDNWTSGKRTIVGVGYLQTRITFFPVPVAQILKVSNGQGWPAL